MAALPYMQLYVADYLADTMHLTTEEHGAYLLLIFNYWQTGKAIPVTRLARIARLSNDRWTDVERSLNEFFNERSGEWFHARIERDLEALRAAQEQRIAAGKASAEARKQAAKGRPAKPRNARSTPVEVPLNGNPTNKEEKRREENIETPPPTPHAQEFDSRTKFAMTADWAPGEKTFPAVLLQLGIAGHDFDQDLFLEFRSFWLASPDDHRTHAKWEHALASHLKRNLRTQQATGSNDRGYERSGNAQAKTQGSAAQGYGSSRQGPRSVVEQARERLDAREAARQAAGASVVQDD